MTQRHQRAAHLHRAPVYLVTGGGVSTKRRRYRQARPGEIVCRCGCYDFPHRWSGGSCTCQRWVRRFYDPHGKECRHCINRDGADCQVVTQVEEVFHCPALRDYVRYEGVVLYGRAREAYARATRQERRRAA